MTGRTYLRRLFPVGLVGLICLVSTYLGASPAAASSVPVGSWKSTGPLTVARGFHTADRNAIRLGNGKLLVEGGEGTNGRDWSTITAAADLFDPATGTWTATGSLATGRDFHSATLLQDGRVLVAGGYDAWGNSLASTEIYDPSTGAWSSAAPMNISRGYHTATLLSDGRVLVVGGDTGSSWTPTASAEIYNPTTNTWTLVSSPTGAHAEGVAALLPDGRVLVAGGYQPGGAIQQTAAAEIFDPVAGTWSPAPPMHSARTGAVVAVVGGKVLVAGGEQDYTGYLASAELFNPRTGIWAVTGTMKARHACAASAELPDGRVLVAGGFGPASSGYSQTTVETYSLSTGTWTKVASLTTASDHAVAGVLGNGQVVVAGGYYNLAGLSASQIYTP